MAKQTVNYFIVGDIGVGKSALVERVVQNQFSSDTKVILSNTMHFNVTADVEAWIIEIPGFLGRCRLLKSHLAGFGTMEYKRPPSDVLIAMFDVTNRRTFSHLPSWIAASKEYIRRPMSILIVGTNNDLLDREVSHREAFIYARAIRSKYFEISVPVDDSMAELVLELKRHTSMMSEKD